MRSDDHVFQLQQRAEDRRCAGMVLRCRWCVDHVAGDAPGHLAVLLGDQRFGVGKARRLACGAADADGLGVDVVAVTRRQSLPVMVGKTVAGQVDQPGKMARVFMGCRS